MKELWRDVPGYEGFYQISIDTKEGRCRSLNYWKTKQVKELSNRPKKGGNNSGDRIWWTLSKNGVHTFKQAAYWIAITFPELIENEQFEGAVVDHKDTDPLNNHPSNLRWVTQRGNMNNPLTKKHLSDSLKGRTCSKDTRAKISESQRGEKHWFYGKHHSSVTKQKMSVSHKGKGTKPVEQYSKSGTLIAVFDSINDAQNTTGIKCSQISYCCRGKYGFKTAGGFIWKYK